MCLVIVFTQESAEEVGEQEDGDDTKGGLGLGCRVLEGGLDEEEGEEGGGQTKVRGSGCRHGSDAGSVVESTWQCVEEGQGEEMMLGYDCYDGESREMRAVEGQEQRQGGEEGGGKAAIRSSECGVQAGDDSVLNSSVLSAISRRGEDDRREMAEDSAVWSEIEDQRDVRGTEGLVKDASKQAIMGSERPADLDARGERGIPRSRASAAHEADAQGDGGEGEWCGQRACGAEAEVAKAAARLAELYRRPLPLPWLPLADLPTHSLAAAAAKGRGGDGSAAAVSPRKVRRWLRAARDEALRECGRDEPGEGLGKDGAQGGLAPDGITGGREHDAEDVEEGVWEEATRTLPSCVVSSNLKAVLRVLREGERSEDRVEGGEDRDGGRGGVESLALRLALICQALPPGGVRRGIGGHSRVQSGVGVLAP